MSETPPPAKVEKVKARISAIWLIPFIAAIFGIYLGVKAYQDRGVMITLELESSEGLIAGKSEVRYKGMTAGKVKKLELSSQMDRVIATIEMDPQAEPYLNNHTLFWVVKPEVRLSGINGLETLLTGNYIKMRPDINTEGVPQYYFVAESDPPPLPKDTPGLHLSLTTHELGSLDVGDKVYHRQIPVGEVTSYQFDDQRKVIDIAIFIEPQHSHLVSANTRFWNASGIQITGDLSGISIETESIGTIIEGGIAFGVPENVEPGELVDNFTTFKLYDDYRSASVGLPIQLEFEYDSGVTDKTKIIFQGFDIGKIESHYVDMEARKIFASATIDPLAKPILKDQTQFFLVSPKITISKIANLDTLFSGRYISFVPSFNGNPISNFHVFNEPPPLNEDYPGLHLTLTTKDTGSISYDTPVIFRHITIGSVQKVSMNKQKDGFEIKILVREPYAHLINKSSRFWNGSGFRFKGGLTGFEFESESLETLLSGGIVVETYELSDKNAPPPSKNGDTFWLYKNADNAQFTHKITLNTDFDSPLKPGVTPVRYRGVKIGEVLDVERSTQASTNQAKVTIGLLDDYAWVAKNKPYFWLHQPQILKDGVSKLLDGMSVVVEPKKGAGTTTQRIHSHPPIPDKQSPGMQLELIAEQVFGLEANSPIYFNGEVVGQIDAYWFNAGANNFTFAITILPTYAGIIQTESRFYAASGIRVEAGLDGIDVQADTLTTIAKGGIALYNPPQESKDQVQEGGRFQLYANLNEAKNAGISLLIHAESADGLRINMPIRFQDQQVGEIKAINFNPGLQGVTLQAQLYADASSLAKQGAQLWRVQGSLGLVGNKDIASLITGGYIAIQGGYGEPRREFNLLDYEPPRSGRATGLNLELTGKKLGSIRVGDPVTFKQVPVGEVLGVELGDGGKEVKIYINIESRYEKLVKPDTKFWNASGMRLEAGLIDGIEVDLESIEALLAGGIAFATPDDSEGEVNNGHSFRLYSSIRKKWRKWMDE